MGKIKYILLSTLILCCFYPNILSAQNQNVEKKNQYSWGFSWKFGYSQFMALNDFSYYLKGGAGIQTEMDILYKRFEFCASTNPSFTRAKNNFTLNNNTVNINDKVEVGMAGFSVSYAIVYNDYLKISPLAGTVWCSLTKNENTRTKNIFTETIGLQIEYNFGGVGALGGLTGGLCLPLYLKYNYCFPQKYGNEINSGMHFITIGLGIYIIR